MPDFDPQDLLDAVIRQRNEALNKAAMLEAQLIQVMKEQTPPEQEEASELH